MQHTSATESSSRRHWMTFFAVLGFLLPIIAIALYLVHVTNEMALEDSLGPTDGGMIAASTDPFPVGVNPKGQSIAELPNVESHLEASIQRGTLTPTSSPDSASVPLFSNAILEKIIARLTLFDWYQNLAAGGSRVLIIQPGERKEQIAMNIGKVLRWSEDEKREFLASIVSSDPILLEGKFAPGTYVVSEGAKPSDVAPLVLARFGETILMRYPKDVSAQVPLHDALTIASLLEREAYDFEDMRYIAGVIWNRLFIDMNLQIDATLQYAKGTDAPKTWWPMPVPKDKYIESPYNTYQNSGLPPTPIANPSPDAVLAALNPRETDCMYYFHDKDSGFHCTETYEEHVAELKKYYGRGR